MNESQKSPFLTTQLFKGALRSLAECIQTQNFDTDEYNTNSNLNKQAVLRGKYGPLGALFEARKVAGSAIYKQQHNSMKLCCPLSLKFQFVYSV